MRALPGRAVCAIALLAATACSARQAPATARKSDAVHRTGDKEESSSGAESSRREACASESDSGSRLKRREAVAVTDDARIVVLDSRTGAEVRKLADLSHAMGLRQGVPFFPLGEIALSPDRAELFYAERFNRRSTVVCRVLLLEGRTERIARGEAPAVSPDGAELALAVAGKHSPHSAIAVLDLRSGERYRIELDDDEEDFFQVFGTITEISWSGDEDVLAYTLDYEGPETHVLDLTEDQSLSSARYLEGFLASPTWMTDRIVGLIESCCYPEWKKEPGRALVYDLTTATKRPLRTSGPAATIDAGRARKWLTVLRGGRLEIASRGRRPKSLGSGYLRAVW